MANQKINLTGKNPEDLQAELTTLEQEYQQLRFDHVVRSLPNPMEIRDARRNIARVRTALRQLDIQGMTPEDTEQRSKLRLRRRRQRKS
jgi:large subunit ribosomal protein L29